MAVERGLHQLNQPLGPGPAGGEPPLILVADDEPHLVDLLALLLDEEGYRVARAYDGRHAWELARRLCPDLIITDVMMPGLTGPELLARLRQQAEEPGRCPPAILLSAVTAAEGGPGVHFVPKPFDLDRLVALVAALLAGARRQAPASAPQATASPQLAALRSAG